MKNEFPRIITERILLRQITENDLENIYNGLSNPIVNKYYGVNFDSIEATKEQMSWFADREQTKTGIWWAVCSPDNQTFFGPGGLNNLSQKNKKAEIGFWLIPEFWGQGLMKEAMSLICKYGFDQF